MSMGETVHARSVGRLAEVKMHGQALRVAHSAEAGCECCTPSELIVAALAS